MRQKMFLGGRSRDLRSRESREQAINCYLELDNDGEFKRLSRTPGFKYKITVGTGAIRGIYSTGKDVYVVSGSEAYRVLVNPFGELFASLIGNVSGFEGPVSINAVGADNPQIMFLTSGSGYIYKTSDGTFTEITDPTFDPDYSVVSFNDRFWLNKPNSNQFYASNILDGLTYDPLFFAQADNNPDPILANGRVGTSLLLFGENSTEQWYDPGTVTVGFTLLRIQGATLNRGIASAASLAQWENNLFWLADDYTIRSIGSGGMAKISDLPIETEIATYSHPKACNGFVVDYPYYKCYVLSFFRDNVTWCYDIMRKIWHKRSTNSGKWKISCAANFNEYVILGDDSTGSLYVMDGSTYLDGGEKALMRFVTPAHTNDDSSMTYSNMEIVADMGVGTIGNVDSLGIPEPLPLDATLNVSRSVDGGFTYLSLPSRSLGRVGDRGSKMIWRNPIRVPRTNNLVHAFEADGDYPVNIYSAYIDGVPGIV